MWEPLSHGLTLLSIATKIGKAGCGLCWPMTALKLCRARNTLSMVVASHPCSCVPRLLADMRLVYSAISDDNQRQTLGV